MTTYIQISLYSSERQSNNTAGTISRRASRISIIILILCHNRRIVCTPVQNKFAVTRYDRLPNLQILLHINTGFSHFFLSNFQDIDICRHGFIGLQVVLQTPIMIFLSRKNNGPVRGRAGACCLKKRRIAPGPDMPITSQAVLAVGLICVRPAPSDIYETGHQVPTCLAGSAKGVFVFPASYRRRYALTRHGAQGISESRSERLRQ